jgi:hypothetical protein
MNFFILLLEIFLIIYIIIKRNDIINFRTYEVLMFSLTILLVFTRFDTKYKIFNIEFKKNCNEELTKK